MRLQSCWLAPVVMGTKARWRLPRPHFGSSPLVVSSSLLSPEGVGGSGRDYPPLLASGSFALI